MLGLFKVAAVTSVILSAAKNPVSGTEILRLSQGDKEGL